MPSRAVRALATRSGREGAHAVALHFMHCNFCPLHTSLGMTPAMAAGVSTRFMEIGDIVDLVEAAAPKPNRPKTYAKRKNSKGLV